eukprot:CAMPEP_0182861940 /NCGR_PEP_ID=MMETSP0034_2-20130328/5778_1 /TAXON_ID=156128 /ORGANISM="Nephroselmis pyriformis, Strain CCMP717" /LENGTH=780 /DNA_ID=CAMNT_0024993931 /DNA_START=175 /DNA_END=2517 /DNA_ORIENTATION=-
MGSAQQAVKLGEDRRRAKRRGPLGMLRGGALAKTGPIVSHPIGDIAEAKAPVAKAKAKGAEAAEGEVSDRDWKALLAAIAGQVASKVVTGCKTAGGATKGAGAVGAGFLLLALNIFGPRKFRILKNLGLLAHPKVVKFIEEKVPAEHVPKVARALGPLEPFSKPAVAWTVAKPVAHIVAPSICRTLRFYRHVCPIACGYLKTIFFETRKGKKLTPEQVEDVWDKKHTWGADRAYNMLTNLGGFYPKVGQVFASKADLLPPQYTARLKRVFDACPHAAFKEIRGTVEGQLKRKLEDVYLSVETEPLATATIAQVHRARTLDNEDIVIKVQHKGMEQRMYGDMNTMLNFSLMMEGLGLNVNFDHVSVLREYREQVPHEFDFTRELRLLDAISGSLVKAGIDQVVVPQVIRELCGEKIITMHFLKGTSIGQLIEMPRENIPPSFDGTVFFTRLLEAFGQQIFVDGLFHSDPHPGNVLWMPDGKVGLLDFGECKDLADKDRLLFAKLTVALAQRNVEVSHPLMEDTGLLIEGASKEFAITCAYILFDTRMDIPEAHMTPLDADAEELRSVNIKHLPQELFMIVRVVTLFRGMLSALDVDVSAAKVWEPFARRALDSAGVEAPLPPLLEVATRSLTVAVGETDESGNFSPGPETQRHKLRSMTMYDRMKELAMWMRDNGFQADRAFLTPAARAGLTTVHDIADADQATLDKGLKKYSVEERGNIAAAAKKWAAEEDAKDAQAFKEWERQSLIRREQAQKAAAPRALPKDTPRPKKKGGIFSCFSG